MMIDELKAFVSRNTSNSLLPVVDSSQFTVDKA